MKPLNNANMGPVYSKCKSNKPSMSLDFLVGKSSLLVKDNTMLERLEDIAKLPAAKQIELFNVMDAYLRDYRTSKAYKIS